MEMFPIKIINNFFRINLQKGDVDEEVLGHIRSAAGKARLLATKKFKQFEGNVCFQSFAHMKCIFCSMLT